MLIGQERVIQYLDAVKKRGTMAHAYLFFGPESVGKATVATRFAQSFFCDQAGGSFNKVCGLCDSCVRIVNGKHPNVFWLDLERTLTSKKDKRKDIPIEDIRELKRILSYAPKGGEWRVAIINEAERMSQEAANAFLKLLEEPGSRIIFILISHEPVHIPQTIASRAQPLRFSLVSQPVIARFFSSSMIKREEDIRDAVILSAGRPGRATRFAEDPDTLRAEQALYRSVASAFLGGLAVQLAFSSRISGDEVTRRRAIEHLMCMLRERLKRGEGNLQLECALLKEMHRIAVILDTTNVNPRLALDVLFLAAQRRV